MSRSSELRSSLLGRILFKAYGRLPFRLKVLKLAVRLEGGQFYSSTLRKVLSQAYGVDVGPYSYGSLLEPKMADSMTTIGSYVSIGPNVRRIGAAHPLSHLSLHPFWYNASLGWVGSDQDVKRTPCVIEDDAWIGANVTILPSCTRVGVGAVIGAGSVVTSDVPDFTIVAGNPARSIGERLTERQRQALRDRDPWKHDPAEARNILDSIEDDET